MDLVLRQLGGLLLGSVPTILLFFLILFLYGVLVYRPLTRVLEERRKRTEGAMEQANLTLASADAKAQEYEAKVRAARLEIFHAREQRLQQWNREREVALATVAQTAGRRVEEAKAALEAETAQARAVIESSAGELAKQVLEAVLPRDAARDLAVSGSSH